MTDLLQRPLRHPIRAVSQAVAGYAPDDERPLGGYAKAMSLYTALTVSAGAVARWRGRQVPSVAPFDVLLLACATHKLSRLIAKDAVTSPLRAPFTQFQGSAGDAELSEEVIGDGTRHVVGELLTCPFCLAQWIATGFAVGFVFAPRATRLAAATMTAVAGSDFLQLAYAWGQQKAEA